MNVLFKYLESFNFTRTNLELSVPLVIHAVPGAGKTTLLRTLIKEERGFTVHTAGAADEANLEGVGIEKQEGGSSNFRILDEYITSTDTSGYQALFSDPIQNQRKSLPAHFVKYKSYRVPRSICVFINKELGIPIDSEVEGSLTFEDFFGPEPVGTVVAIELEVINFLKSYGIDVKSPCEIRGLEFETVSLFLTEPLKSLPLWEIFVALTRVKRKLVIRCTNAVTSTRL